MKRSELTSITTRNKGTLRGQNIENILERHYGKGTLIITADPVSPLWSVVGPSGFIVDEIIVASTENMRSRNDWNWND